MSDELIVTPDTRIEYQLPSGTKVKLKPINASNFHAVIAMTKLQGKIDEKTGLANLTKEDSDNLLKVVTVSIDSWSRKEECSPQNILKYLLFADIVDLIPKIADLNFREPVGNNKTKETN